MDKMTVVEIDRDLAARLEVHPALKDKLTIIQQDAMTIDFAQLAKPSVSNLCGFLVTCTLFQRH